MPHAFSTILINPYITLSKSILSICSVQIFSLLYLRTSLYIETPAGGGGVCVLLLLLLLLLTQDLKVISMFVFNNAFLMLPITSGQNQTDIRLHSNNERIP